MTSIISCRSATDYSFLYELIQSRTGIRLTDHQREDIVIAVENLLQTQSTTNFPGLMLHLSSESVEHPVWQPIIRVATVGETYFFRNQSQFDALRNSVLPTLIDQRRRMGAYYLRLWSAGCSGGEEPYSLAMLLRDLIPDIDLWSITILGTDINQASLDRARAGLYRTWSFRSETPSDLSARWFRITSEGCKIADSIRQLVKFAPLNLVTDSYPTVETDTMNMDLIMCRNVTIYFDLTTTREVVSRFHRSLNDNGWLVVGHSEPMAAIYEDWFEPYNFDNTVLYRRIKPPVQPAVTLLSATRPTPAQSQTAPLSANDLSGPDWSARPKAEPLPTASRNTPLPKTAPLVITPKAAPQITLDDILTFAKQAADQEQWAEALNWLVQAEDQDRLNPQIHYLRALVQMHQDQSDSAFLSLRQAIYCDPNFALAHYTLAELYQQRGELKEAVRHLQLTQRALARLPPDHRLFFSDDLTVEMMHELLTHRLRTLPEARHVAL